MKNILCSISFKLLRQRKRDVIKNCNFFKFKICIIGAWPYIYITYHVLCVRGSTVLSRLGPPHYRDFTITLRHTTGLLWTSDQPNAEISTWQQTTIARHRISCPRRDSQPQFQQSSCGRPTPYTTPSLGPAICIFLFVFSDLTTVNYIGYDFQWENDPEISSAK